MHLKALKLQGFKSFADPTTLRFEPGVTAVVGPNGCGKSNIADAIRWVLGEQSAKALRGGKMQDVIFEGADTRKPSQICEVALLLTDCEKQLGSEFHEIEIMRRVHRDGQGEYFFNGQACRLKDIQKLFMDTGIGRTSYSIMAQGQIDQILSSKPEERRAVFEEAAGITKYKSQRREALQKLTLTDQNLARVADVIGEVGRQIGSLRRQASKAVRYKKLNYRLRHLALSHAGQQHAGLSAALSALEDNVIKLRAAAETRRIELQQRQSQMEERRAERSRLNQRVQDAQQAVFDLRSEKEQAENNANLATIKRAGLADRLASSQQNLGEIDMQIRELASQVDSGAHDKQLQLELLGTSDSSFQNRNRELTVVEGELTKIDQELQQAKFTLLQLESNVARLRTDCSGYEVDQKTSIHKHEAVVAEIESVRQQHSATTQLASEFESRVEEALQEKARAHSQSQETQQAITDLTRDFRDQQKKLQDIDRQLAQRTARLRLLQQLQEKWEGFGEGSKALLQGRLDSALAGTKAAPITHGLEVRPECAKALEALLGSTVEAIHVADLDTAQRILAQLESEQIGAAVLQVPSLSPISHTPSSLPSFLQPATNSLLNTADSHPAVALLSACYLADDLGTFLSFWKENPSFNFLAVATRKGEVVDRRGLISGGHQKRPTASILQREVDLRETSKALADDQKAHDDQKVVIDALSARLSEAESKLEQDRTDILAATQNLASVQSEQRTIVKQTEEIAARLARMENELNSLENVRAEAESRFAKAQTTLLEVEANITAGRERIHQMETRINELRTDRDVRRDTLGQARLELAERRQKVEVLDRGLADMERRRRQLSELLIQRQQEVETWTDQVATLEREADAQRARSAQLAESLVVAQGQVEQIRHELVDLERSMGDSENSQYNLRTESDQAQSELSKCEIKLAETKSRAQFIEEDVQREFQIRVGTYDWRALLWKSDEEPPDLKQLDLDDDEEEGIQNSESRIQNAEPGPGGAPVPGPDSGVPPESSESVTESAPQKRRRKKTPKPDATEEDLVALETSTDWNALKAEIEAIRQRLANMGAVNVLAIEEYAELKQRYDFLKGQSDDLTTSKTELLKAIDEINQTSQQQFAITFEQIRKNFVYTFQTLFGGGVANLELVQQSDDPLECGIEITAQPPGTKLKSITLLSGGQKTLTAVGLLFALYMVKPSPFCLLDELDAPLDESNIGRFTDLLKKFIHDSQFIIITHNKRTVAAAHAIYGVTMEERGVSKTVSMKFNHLLGEPKTPTQNIAEAVRGTRAPVGV